ncbi:MAG: histidinol dehydrogenase [Mycobacteriales bacterium]|nr:histidinol dehydrogenase [Mycobacteriales bacterium]
MLTRIDLRGRRDADPLPLLPRAVLDVAAGTDLVRPTVEDVRDRGLAAVLDATERFDGVRLETVRVPAEALTAALAALDPAVRAALEEAVVRARRVSTAQLRADEVVQVVEGATVTERWVPVRRVGLYVPGGRVAYPSSVVMNVVPAQVAGVESLAVCSPPKADGLPHPVVMAACALLGVEEVYAVGGAQAVAMLAYGIEGCPRVDVITGPGNVYVTAAKRLVQGKVGIDSEAGPTEIAILADDTAVAAHVAADLVAQAEHDPLAACLLVTPSEALLDAVDAELRTQVPASTHRERIETALAGQSSHVLVEDLEQGLEVVDAWAAEHLEVITADAPERARRVRNAGAVFIGGHTPVSLGDYLAGSNHVLPTGGTARFSSGLSAQSFLKRMSLVHYTAEALATVAPHVTALGGAEDLHAHVEAVQVRVRDR